MIRQETKTQHRTGKNVTGKAVRNSVDACVMLTAWENMSVWLRRHFPFCSLCVCVCREVCCCWMAVALFLLCCPVLASTLLHHHHQPPWGDYLMVYPYFLCYDSVWKGRVLCWYYVVLMLTRSLSLSHALPLVKVLSRFVGLVCFCSFTFSMFHVLYASKF